MRAALSAVALLLVGCAGGQTQVAQDLALTGEAIFVGPVLATGLATGRDAAEGPDLLWLADDHLVRTLSKDGAEEEAWKPPLFSRLIRFEAADLDGDGIHEWVVLLDQGHMRSLIIGVDEDGARAQVGKPYSGYLRPLVDASGAVVLVGQRAGADAPFRGQVQRVERDEAGKWIQGESLGLPADVAIYDFFVLPTGDEHGRLFGADDLGKLTERDPRTPRSVTWRSDDRVAGRPLEIERNYQNLLGESQEETLALLPPVTLLGDNDGDGLSEVLLVGGVHNPVAVLRNLRVWQGGDVRLYRPSTRGLEEVRRTPLVGRAVVAATTWQIGPNDTVWAAAVWTRPAGGMARPESRVFLFDPATGDLLGSGPRIPTPPATPVGGKGANSGGSPE